MSLIKSQILVIVCPSCSQIHKVPADRFRTELSRATMQCAKCGRQFNLMEQGEKPRVTAKNVPNLWVLGGVLAVIVAALVVVFLSLAARTSGEESTFAELPEQVQVALFGAEEDGSTAAPEGLILTMDKGYKLVRRKSKTAVLVVKGRVRNPGPDVRTRIILEGRIVGADGSLRFVTRSPCGKMFSDKRLKRTKPGKYAKLFTKNKELVNCTLKPGQEKPFQMIFDDIPKDYNEAYTVQVKPLFSGVEQADSE